MLLFAEYANQQFSSNFLNVHPTPKSKHNSVVGSVKNSSNRRKLDFGIASKMISKFNRVISNKSPRSNFPNSPMSFVDSGNDSSSSNTFQKLAQKKSKFAELAAVAKKGSNFDSFPELSDDEETNGGRRAIFKQQKSRTIELDNQSPYKPGLDKIEEKETEDKQHSKFDFSNTEAKQVKQQSRPVPQI